MKEGSECSNASENRWPLGESGPAVTWVVPELVMSKAVVDWPARETRSTEQS